MSREHISTGLEVAGLTLASVGVWVLSIPAGLVATGLTLAFVGVALDPPRRKGRS